MLEGTWVQHYTCCWMCVCVCPTLDGPIRANRCADSSDSLDSRESFMVPDLNPFLRSALRGRQQIANRRFEAIRVNRSHIPKV